MNLRFIQSDKWQVTGDMKKRLARDTHSCHLSTACCAEAMRRRVTCHREQALRHPSLATRHHGERGIALVITLIMLAVTLVMAVAFLALSRRERGSVSTNTDTIVAQNAAQAAAQNAMAQIVANFLSSSNDLVSSNAYNLSLIVSTNYINPAGFINNLPNYYGNPANVNYTYANGNPLSVVDFEQNVSNLWYLPRAPVFVPQGQPVTSYDFRYYLDLNENGEFEPNGWQPVISDNPTYPYYDTNGNPVATFNPSDVLSNFFVGDPEWVGVLQHPDAPHGPNNQFVSRYAFVALPVGNTLDVNYSHNQAITKTVNNSKGASPSGDGYFRNQGIGSWELNLAGFLADLNTNIWGRVVGSGQGAPAGSAQFYQYNETASPRFANSGVAFDDARALVSYRYNFNYNSLPSALNLFVSAGTMFPYDGIDDYSQGPLQTTLDTNEDFLAPAVNVTVPWLGADNTNNRFFTVGDFFDASKFPPGGNQSFPGRLSSAGTWTVNGRQPTYDRYTFYRMLNELGTDSSPDEGKLDLNYSNAVVTYINIGANVVEPGPAGISIIPNAETNLVRWRPLDFFVAAADQMLRTYSSYWYNESPTAYIAYTNTFGITNSYFSITNIPVWVSNRWVYTPAVNRLLQMAANIYDATTNGNNNLPHVFKPILERVNDNGDIFIVGYKEVTSVSAPGIGDLQAPYDITQLYAYALNQPIMRGGFPVNVYGVPWIIGAKKGLPNFNQLALVSAAQISRKLELTRSSLDPYTATYETNEMYVMGITNYGGISFWNSYSNAYVPRTGPLRVYASDVQTTVLTNGQNGAGYYIWPFTTNFVLDIPLNSWPGSQWSATHGSTPNTDQPNGNSFLYFNWVYPFQSSLVYNFDTHQFQVNDQWWPVTQHPQLDQFGLLITNRLQAYILDGNNVIDYVQLRDPISQGGINQALADPPYPQPPNNARLQWSTNAYNPPPVPWGVINQIVVSANSTLAPQGGTWSMAPTPMGDVSPAAEAAYFSGFFKPYFQYNGVNYVNHQRVTQAPYTPSRNVLTTYLLQANDPLVHSLGSDLNSQVGTWAVWGGKMPYQNGIWTSNDNQTPLPSIPSTPVDGRYQPWGRNHMNNVAGADANPYNLAYKDPLVWEPDFWDFPTNLYPTVGWLGRVHRGTPWQTVYLKSTNILNSVDSSGTPNGFSTWADWTGNIQTNIYAYFFDNEHTAPQQDYLLFDIFTTRFNDNAVRGTLPVNVGVGSPDGGLAAWSALFSGMVVVSNNFPVPFATYGRLPYTSLIIDPAGTDAKNSPLWRIVNDPTNGINATRANKNWFPYQTFAHAGQILATPALSTASPFLSTNALVSGKPSLNQLQYGINDEMYEWLPQQMMGLVRGTEQRFVLYCFGQALRPAPNGMVLSGPYYQLITNYQVVAESAIRAVIRVDNANTGKPHAVVESYNVLPPN